MMTEWLPASPARMERLRSALPSVLDSWLEIDVVPLVRLDVLRRTAGSRSAWVRMPSVLREAAEAVAYLAEVEAEDDGLTHATDAIAALLQAHLGEPERPLSEHELQRHAVEILAPLLAQAVCLRKGDDGS